MHRIFEFARLLLLITSLQQVAIGQSKAETDYPQSTASLAPPSELGKTAQIAFIAKEGMTITWDVAAPGRFDSAPLAVPGRYNFPKGAIRRLKLAKIPGRPGVELYPTLEIGPSQPRTEVFLIHNAVPVTFFDEDFDNVAAGQAVTKVIYLPDPEFQELAIAGVETLVNTRLDPGVDPLVEANRRGAILAIVRLVPNAVVAVTNQVESPRTSTVGPRSFGRRHCCRLDGGRRPRR
jgi:hypothetical protein